MTEQQNENSFIQRVFGNKSEDNILDDVPRGIQVAAAWSWRLLVIIGLLTVVGLLIIELRLLVIPMLLALLLGALLAPAVNWMHSHKVPRWLAVITVELGVIAAIGGLIFLVVTEVRSGFDSLALRSQRVFVDLKEFLNGEPFHISNAKIDEYFNHFGEILQQDMSWVVSGVFSVSSTVGHVLTGVLLTMFALIFVLYDGRYLWKFILRLLPVKARRAVDGGGKAAWVTLSSYIRVQIVVAFIDAVGIGIGAWALGLPMAFPIMVLVFLGSFVPIVGAVLTGALAVFIALVYNGWIIALIMLAVVLVVQQVEGHVLQPWIMGHAVKVHPLAIVLVVAGGTMVAGIAGALFAVPLVAMLNTGIKYISSGMWRTNPDPTIEDVLGT